jgi:chemotaxis protein MotA
VDQLYDLANTARREGLLAMEVEASKIEDPFTQTGLTLLADCVKPEYLQDVLESQIDAKDHEYEEAAAVFEGMGGAGPAMGVLGTVMGMISILRDMSDMDSLGGKIASAFIATMLGVGSANLLFLPLAAHIKAIAAQEREYREVIIDGLLLIQDGMPPKRLQEKLYARIGGKIKDADKEKSIEKES